MADTPKKMLHCRRCGEGFPNIQALSLHVRAAHGAERAATISAGLKKHHADQKKSEPVVGGEPAASIDRARPVRGAIPARPDPTVGAIAHAPSGGNGHDTGCRPTEPAGALCPTCGGVVPVITAQLVSALQAEGLAEAHAFVAARIARKVFGPAIAA
jgi:hypothetical protein